MEPMRIQKEKVGSNAKTDKIVYSFPCNIIGVVFGPKVMPPTIPITSSPLPAHGWNQLKKETVRSHL